MKIINMGEGQGPRRIVLFSIKFFKYFFRIQLMLTLKVLKNKFDYFGLQVFKLDWNPIRVS